MILVLAAAVKNINIAVVGVNDLTLAKVCTNTAVVGEYKNKNLVY